MSSVEKTLPDSVIQEALDAYLDHVGPAFKSMQVAAGIVLNACDKAKPRRCIWEQRIDRLGGFTYIRIGCGGETHGTFPNYCPKCGGKVVQTRE